MVGLLNAPKNTKLYNRLETENRLTTEATGSNTDMSMNFIPAMDQLVLLDGYQSIIRNIYSTKPYYKRLRQFLANYHPKHAMTKKVEFSSLIAFMKTIIIIGILNRGRIEYWKMFFWTIFKHPKLFMDSMTYIVYGYHYRTVYGLRKAS
jgi:hypothetical protein